MDIHERLNKVQERIRAAAFKAGRNPAEIKLIAVSKFNSVEVISELVQADVRDFAENKVQELLEKQPQLPNDLNWHMIGHLQRNKVKYIVRMSNCRLIHSVDSLMLAEEIDNHCAKIGREMEVLIQVNIAEDDAKFGVNPDETMHLVKQVAKLTRVKVKGLMTILPEVQDPEKVRPYFRRLKELALKIKDLDIPSVEMTELSMGMTGDFEVAIEEGATMVRIGSAIFGPRNYT